jgi:hypothetical protein
VGFQTPQNPVGLHAVIGTVFIYTLLKDTEFFNVKAYSAFSEHFAFNGYRIYLTDNVVWEKDKP